MYFLYKQGAGKSPADEGWLRNFAVVLEHGLSSVWSERGIGISAKTQPLPCLGEFIRYSFLYLNTLGECLLNLLAHGRICKITCMLEQHALSKIARSISCWNGVLSYLTLRGAREKKCSGKLLSRFCGGFRVLFGLFVCFPFFFWWLFSY